MRSFPFFDTFKSNYAANWTAIVERMRNAAVASLASYEKYVALTAKVQKLHIFLSPKAHNVAEEMSMTGFPDSLPYDDMGVDNTVELQIEWSYYRDLARTWRGTDREFWLSESAQQQLSGLVRFALTTLPMMTSSAFVESCFSIMEYALNSRRHTMGPDLLETEMMLRCNKQLVFDTLFAKMGWVDEDSPVPMESAPEAFG